MEKSISFTAKVKEEIVTKPFSEERLRSLLSAFIKINGVMEISHSRTTIKLSTENAKIAKYLYIIIQKLYGINAKFSYLKSMRFDKKTSYVVSLEEEADDIMNDLSISFLDGKVSKTIAYNDDTICGYLSGAFLASGLVNSPKNSNYHLEISLNNENSAKWLLKLVHKINNGSFNMKTIMRRNQCVVYLKKSDQIADFLILVGATNSCMEFENIRIDRDFANVGNRLQNCDEANLNKTISAAKRQIEEIKIIDQALGLDNLLNKKELLLCKLRLENEDATMLELANNMSQILNATISKSNVNHLFRKIHFDALKFKGDHHER